MLQGQVFPSIQTWIIFLLERKTWPNVYKSLPIQIWQLCMLVSACVKVSTYIHNHLVFLLYLLLA